MRAWLRCRRRPRADSYRAGRLLRPCGRQITISDRPEVGLGRQVGHSWRAAPRRCGWTLTGRRRPQGAASKAVLRLCVVVALAGARRRLRTVTTDLGRMLEIRDRSARRGDRFGVGRRHSEPEPRRVDLTDALRYRVLVPRPDPGLDRGVGEVARVGQLG